MTAAAVLNINPQSSMQHHNCVILVLFTYYSIYSYFELAFIF